MLRCKILHQDQHMLYILGLKEVKRASPRNGVAHLDKIPAKLFQKKVEEETFAEHFLYGVITIHIHLVQMYKDRKELSGAKI